MSSPPRTKRDVPPRLPSKKQRSQSLTPVQPQIAQRILGSDKYMSADGVIQNGPEAAPHIRRLMQIEKCQSVDGISKRSDENKENGQVSNESIEEKPTSADGVVRNMSRSSSEIMRESQFASYSLPRRQGPPVQKRTSSLSRDTSTHSLAPCIENKVSEEESAPPKPSKDKNKDELAPLNRVASYHASGSDSGNGSGDSAQSSATEDVQQTQNRCGVVIKNPRFIPNSASSVTLKSYADFDPIAAEQAIKAMDIPLLEQVSKFDLELFHTVLLPYNDFRPLDSGTLSTFRMMIGETSSRIIANHITRVDIKLMLEGEFLNLFLVSGSLQRHCR